MPPLVVMKNARIVTPSAIVDGAVTISDGLITAVDDDCFLLSGQAIDLEGDYLIPGLVDIHTDNLERHIMPRSSAEWPVMPALVAHDAQLATAGITTVLDSFCVGTAGVGVRSFEKVEEAICLLGRGTERGMFRSEHFLHLRTELSNENTISMLSKIYRNPNVRLISVMDHTPGQRQWANLEKYIAMEKRDYKMAQNEIDSFVSKVQANHEKYSQANRREVLSMVSELPIVLASHDDTTLEHVEQAHTEGIHISEFPTTLLAAEAARERKMHIVAGSPNLVLGRSHSGNISVEELARLGLLDSLASDYAPSSLLYSAFLMVRKLGFALHEAIKIISLNPSRLVGLDDRGSIEVGKRADLVRVKEVDGVPLITMVWRQGVRIA
jgi:alpha-D-ribose 1-methylphosphonate 5-triphosphate diphosphatase